MSRTISNTIDEVKINVRSILDAYHTTGLTPIQGEYLLRKDNKWCGCVIVSLWLKHQHNPVLSDELTEDEIIDIVEHSVDWANLQFGVNNTLALLLGFDNYPKGKYFDFVEGEYYTIGRWAANQLGLNKLEDAKRD